jgi:hypothetical protein
MRRLLFAAVAAAVILSGCSATVTGSPAPTGAVTSGTAEGVDRAAQVGRRGGDLRPLPALHSGRGGYRH